MRVDDAVFDPMLCILIDSMKRAHSSFQDVLISALMIMMGCKAATLAIIVQVSTSTSEETFSGVILDRGDSRPR